MEPPPWIGFPYLQTNPNCQQVYYSIFIRFWMVPVLALQSFVAAQTPSAKPAQKMKMTGALHKGETGVYFEMRDPNRRFWYVYCSKNAFKGFLILTYSQFHQTCAMCLGSLKLTLCRNLFHRNILHMVILETFRTRQ